MLEIQNMTKIFNEGTVNEKTAINNVSIKINDGDFITVIGGNGAGKSTLLNLISGLYIADSGSIEIDDLVNEKVPFVIKDIFKKRKKIESIVNITKLPEHKRAKYFGRVFQDPMTGTVADMEIQENLALALRRGKFRGLSWAIKSEEKELYIKQLKRLDLGLEDRITSKVGLLSGGQRQALTLLMATIVKPKMLLLDEHTAALDPKTALKVQDLTEELTKENNITTLMITHNMKDAIKYGNRLIMMHDGKIIFEVSGEEKASLKVKDLLQKFETTSGNEFVNDKNLLV